MTAVATAKHYAVHSGPEPLRHGFDAIVSKHDLEDTYLPAFRDAVVDGKVQAVMCVYNAINGVPGCAHKHLLDETLRAHWGFSGFVTGDCDAVRDIYTGHKYVKSLEEAAAVAIRAGTDNDCQVVFGPRGAAPEYQKYVDAVKQGLLREAEIDVAVKRMMRTRFALGLFDPPELVKPAQTPETDVDSEAHRALAARIARETMVLLKNDGALPLAAGVKQDRRRRTARGSDPRPPRQLQRHAVARHDRARRPPEAFRDVRRGLRARDAFPAASAARPVLGAPHRRRRSRLEGRGLRDARTGGRARRDKDRRPAGARRSARHLAEPLPAATAGAGHPLDGMADAGRVRLVLPLGVEGCGNRLFLDGKTLVDTTGGFPPPPTRSRWPSRRAGATPSGSKPCRASSRRHASSGLPPMPRSRGRAVAAARDADVVVAVVGITSDLEGEETGVDQPGFKGGDRTSLDLPREEQRLLEAVKATGKPLVVVVMSGSAIALNWAKQHANAILQAWYPGRGGGHRHRRDARRGQQPCRPAAGHRSTRGSSSCRSSRTTRWRAGRTGTSRGEPLYPFGHGLSYSTFAYSGLQAVEARDRGGGAPRRSRSTVKNTSGRDGDEVVQAYLVFPNCSGRLGTPCGASRGSN